ncbi:MAG: hypothetical protein AB7F32_07995 [Victivallaceae bacterium]
MDRIMDHTRDAINGAGFTADFKSLGETIFELDAGSGRAAVGGALCDGFGEARVEAKKLKIHRTLDGILVSAESEKVIPFGCEYDVRRSFSLLDGLLRVTADFRTVGRQVLRELRLDPVTLSGDWRRLGISRDGVSVEWHDLPYSEEAPQMPVFYLAEAVDGTLWEFGCGEDLWRCRAGRELGGEAAFTVEATAQRMCFERLIFRFAPEMVLQRRPWRFGYYLAWSGAADAAAATGEVIDLGQLAIPPGGRRSDAKGQVAPGFCLAAPAVQRLLRDTVRRSAGPLVIRGGGAGCCCSAGHLDRANKGTLLHRDLEAAMVFYEWANRQLDKIGAGLVFEGNQDTASARVLARVPRKFE